jgi:hypothetical protein
MVDSTTGGGSGSTNVNVGSGFRLAVPSTNNIKTLFCVGCTADSATNANAITLTVPAGTADSTKFVTFFRMFKNAVALDTLWTLVYAIPAPDLTTGTANGTPIKWKYLSGAGHGFSPFLDPRPYVNSSANLTIGFPTVQDVGPGILWGDEFTKLLNTGEIGNQDNYECVSSITYGGLGANMVGNNTNTLQVQHSTLEGWTLTFDTIALAQKFIISMTLTDPSGKFRGAPNDQTQVIYNGNNAGFHLARTFSGLGIWGYKYYMLDGFNDTVSNYYPQATDRFTISNGSITDQNIDYRQFLTNATVPYFGQGLANFWLFGMVKRFPDSLTVLRPANLTATASGTPGQINVTWSAVTVNAAGGYQVDRSTNYNFSGGVTTIVNGSTGTSFNDTGLVTGTTYYYRIKAIRIPNVFSGWTDWVSAVAP